MDFYTPCFISLPYLCRSPSEDLKARRTKITGRWVLREASVPLFFPTSPFIPNKSLPLNYFTPYLFPDYGLGWPICCIRWSCFEKEKTPLVMMHIYSVLCGATFLPPPFSLRSGHFCSKPFFNFIPCNLLYHLFSGKASGCREKI